MEAVMMTSASSTAYPAYFTVEASKKQCFELPTASLRLTRRAVAYGQGKVAWSQSFGQGLWNHVQTDGQLKSISVKSGKCFATSAVKTVKWVLLPIGDGDVKHLDGDTVETPGILELTNDISVVGRIGDKADILLKIATVSGAHAQLEKKDGSLYVTDLESTNGTYMDNKKLTPGIAYPVEAGTALIFGDEHLAQFRFVQIEEDKSSE